jgi:hypothetical protein
MDKRSYYNHLNAQCQCIILQLKHYISNMFRSFIDNQQEDHASFNSLMMLCERWKHVGGTFFFVIKPTECTNFTNLFCHETLHVSDSSSVHHQEFIHCTFSNGICHRGTVHTAFEQDQDGIGVHVTVYRKKFLCNENN